MNKLYPCKKCGRKVPIRSKGMCPSCREADRREMGEETMHTRPKRQIRQTRRKTSDELEGFYKKQVELLEKAPFCFESGDRISYPSKLHVAHLLPKRIYKSVATDDRNVVFLTWDLHSLFDKLLDEYRFDDLVNKFPKTCKKLQGVLSLATEPGKLKLALEEYFDTNN